MKTCTIRHKPETRLVLRTFQMITVIGLILSIATLARDTAPTAEWRHLLYTSWFAIAVVSIEAVLHWI